MTSLQIRGALYGLLVGDALGVPYEFSAPSKLPPRAQIEMTPPADWQRTYPIPDGTWSDDSAGALALLDSLLDCQGLSLEDLAMKLAAWQQDGEYAVDKNVFDIGITTSAAIRRYRLGFPAEDSGPDDDMSNGNGSLMRVLPLALWHRGDDFSLARDAMRQSLVTHGHLRSQLCCAIYCLWARRIGEGTDSETSWKHATSQLRELLPQLHESANKNTSPETWQSELDFHIRPDDDTPGQGSGYVVDALRSARDAMRERDYESVVKYAVALGQDTDTTACIAGGVAGLRDGTEAIPARWLEALRGKEIVEGIVAKWPESLEA